MDNKCRIREMAKAKRLNAGLSGKSTQPRFVRLIVIRYRANARYSTRDIRAEDPISFNSPVVNGNG